MKVILLQDFPPLGKKNDVKDISDGYARNFLFPRNLAKPATEAALKELAILKARKKREEAEEYQKYKALAEKLKSLTLKFKVRLATAKSSLGDRHASQESLGREEGRLFGSVTAVKIRDALEKEGIKIEKEWVMLDKPIKTTGEKMVNIKLPHGLRGEVKVVIEAE